MGKIDEMIEQLCPNGVSFKRLDEVCTFQRGTTITAKDAIEGDIPVIAGGQKPAYYHNVSNREGETVVVAGSGAYAGFVSYWTTPIFLSDSFSVNPSEVLLPKYLFYFLKNIQNEIYGTKKGSGVPHVHGSSIAKFEIPVPPIAVQRKIVEVLDNFSELTAELTAELELRKKQYEHYRNELLTFNRGGQIGDIQWKRLGDICNVFTGGEVPDGSIKGEKPEGDMRYPIWGNGKEIYGFANTYQIDQDAVCVSSIGANTGAIFYHTACFTPIIRLKVLTPKNDDLSIRYLYHALSASGFDVKKGSVPNMNANEVKQKIIPVPSKTEQQRIVSILDKFDYIVNDLASGLPAEIAMRTQQYEYYRNKLLTFKRA